MFSYIHCTQNIVFQYGHSCLEQVCVWGSGFSCVLPGCNDFLCFVKLAHTGQYSLASPWCEWTVAGDVLRWPESLLTFSQEEGFSDIWSLQHFTNKALSTSFLKDFLSMYCFWCFWRFAPKWNCFMCILYPNTFWLCCFFMLCQVKNTSQDQTTLLTDVILLGKWKCLRSPGLWQGYRNVMLKGCLCILSSTATSWTHTHPKTCNEINANKHVDFLRRKQHHHKGNKSYPGVGLQDAFPERSIIPLGKWHSTTWHDCASKAKEWYP